MEHWCLASGCIQEERRGDGNETSRADDHDAGSGTGHCYCTSLLEHGNLKESKDRKQRRLQNVVVTDECKTNLEQDRRMSER